MKDWGLLIRVHDRPGALERVLGLARRRAMSLSADSIARGADGLWSVVFRATRDGALVDRYADEFRELVDLEVALPLRVDPLHNPIP